MTKTPSTPVAPQGGANWRTGGGRGPWGVCTSTSTRTSTSSTHAELGTGRTALSPWCSLPPLTRRATAAVVHRRYSRRCTNPLLSQVVVRTLLQGGWPLVPCSSSPSFSLFLFLFLFLFFL